MSTTNQPTVSRRLAVLGGSAALAGVGLIAGGVKTASANHSIQSGAGLGGGGSIELESGAIAQFSVFGSRFTIEGHDEPSIFGLVHLKDDAEFTFTSTSIESYGPIEGDEDNARGLSGTGKLADGSELPFAIRAVPSDTDEPDTIEITIGREDEPVYTVNGPLASGDLTLLSFDFSESE